jgi:hypothetical protein
MSKKNASAVLASLVMALVAIQTVVLPQLAFFLKVGTVDSMFSVGKSVGGALGQAFGNSLFEFIGIILFLA